MVLYLIVTGMILVFFVAPAWFAFRREEAEARVLLDEAMSAGTHEPSTIYPWVNPSLCMGSGTCVSVCPEDAVLQVIDGRARLVNGSECVGHGACAAACPTQAIELRFGTERRGVDIPALDTEFQTNVPGIYVVGELGGMGLIANAVRQGVEAVGYIAGTLPKRAGGALDIVIVGGGPAGIGASLEATRRGLTHVVIEQDELGGSIRHFPRQKIVMSHGLTLPGRPPIASATISKEELVDLLLDAVKDAQLPICERETVLGVRRLPDGVFEVQTSKRFPRAMRVLLAVGRRGSPRKLGVPGEDLAKVAYRLLDPELIQHSHVLVVGGGDSAIEAACSLADFPTNRVTISYRGDSFGRAKAANRARLDAAVERGALVVLWKSEVSSITPDRVFLTTPEGEKVIPNDLVFVFAGGVLPTNFLLAAGVEVERHFGERVETLDSTHGHE